MKQMQMNLNDLATKNGFLEAKNEDIQDVLESLITKMPVSIKNVTDLSDEEFGKIRNNGFGASDSSVLLGVPYHSAKVEKKTIKTLLKEKVEEYYDEEIGKKGSVKKGKALEPFILNWISETLNAIVIKPKDMYTNKKGLNTNFDGVLFRYNKNNNIQAIPAEAKICTVWARKNYRWEESITATEIEAGKSLLKKVLPYPNMKSPVENLIEMRADFLGIPEYYYTQVQQQIYFCDSDEGYLCVVDDANWELHFFTVPRDQQIIDELVKVGFTNYIILAEKKGLPIKTEIDGVEI